MSTRHASGHSAADTSKAKCKAPNLHTMRTPEAHYNCKFSTVSRTRANVRGGLPEATGHSHTDGKSSERLQPDGAVLQPPGDYDVYTLDRLHETLATLFTGNLPTHLWLLKIDTSPDSFGTALLDLRHLPSFTWALKQRELHGREEWSETWIQEPTCTKILEEVPQILKKHLELQNRSMYPDKSSFLKAFLSEGGSD
ncbi:unnamed protein product [Dicrocoelium dendriticum]|nr:unnamed protein product [Dicrocoelium dendriticum]